MKQAPIKALQAFRHAAESGSFKQAAERLYVSQAAISQRIKGLEQQLGISLFRRLTREIELTKEGQQLLPYVQRGFDSLEQGLELLSSDPRPDQLRLTTLPSFASRWLMPRLGKFQKLHPGINLSFTPSLELVDFSADQADLAIRYGKGNYEGVESRLLLQDHLLLVCRPDLLNKQLPVEPQLEQLPLISDNTPECEEQQPFLSSVHLDYNNPRLRVTDSTMLVEALISGQGIGVVRFSLIYELLERGLLVSPLATSQVSTYNYYLVAPEYSFRRQKVSQFEHWLRKEIADIEQSWKQFSP